MTTTRVNPALRTLQPIARPLTGAATDYDPLTDWVGEARFVLVRETSA